MQCYGVVYTIKDIAHKKRPVNFVSVIGLFRRILQNSLGEKY